MTALDSHRHLAMALQPGAGLVRFRLDVQRPGEPMLPHSFHPTHQAAFDAGLLVTTGQSAEALDPPPGWDFRIKEWR